MQLYPHHRAQSAFLQSGLELAYQVFGLFLDLYVAIADQAKQAPALNLVAGKKVVEEQDEEAFQGDDLAGFFAAA